MRNPIPTLITVILAILLSQIPRAHAVWPIEDEQFKFQRYWENVLPRAGRDEKVVLRISSKNDQPRPLSVRIELPEGLATDEPLTKKTGDYKQLTIYANKVMDYFKYRPVQEVHPSTSLSWTVRAEKPMPYASADIVFHVSGEGIEDYRIALPVRVRPPYEGPRHMYVPEPQLPEGGENYLIGALYYPGWQPGQASGWSLLDPYPERRPALGYYDQDDPEVIDWEIKFAAEHGIDFFNFCWYRWQSGPNDPPVKEWLIEPLERLMNDARYRDRFKFTIMWENGNTAGSDSLEDLTEVLTPFWIEKYFTHPSYLLIDNKPVLYVYDGKKYIDALGGMESAQAGLQAMRQLCRDAGFDGLWIIVEYRGVDPDILKSYEQVGFDASFAYCHGFPEPRYEEQAMQGILERLDQAAAASALPALPTWSCFWDTDPWREFINYPWHNVEYWQTPQTFEKLGHALKTRMDAAPEGSLAGRILHIDNWNEWAEGHFVAPSRLAGFQYLEAIRRVFHPEAGPHTDVVPEDVGLGPYEQSYDAWKKGMQEKFKNTEPELSSAKEQ